MRINQETMGISLLVGSGTGRRCSPLVCNMVLMMSQLRCGTSDVYTKTEISLSPGRGKIAFDQVSWTMERSNQDAGLVQRGGAHRGLGWVGGGGERKIRRCGMG